MARHEVKYGAILSYVLIILNSAYGLLIAPYLLGTLGNSEYGVYKTIGAITASIMVLDLGIGGTMQRYVAKFDVEGKRGLCGEYTGMGLLIALAINVLVLGICAMLYPSLESVYGESFSAAELQRAKQIFVLFSVQIVLHIFENVLQGVVAGLNRFVFINSLKIGTLLLRTLLVFVVLPIWRNALTLLYISIAIELVLLVMELLYLSVWQKIRIRFAKIDWALLKESAAYTAMMFVQTMTAQVNANLDNAIIGALIGTVAVSVYSFGLTIFNMFQQLSTAISGVMLPTVTKAIKDGADNKDLEDVVIAAGRVQFLLLGSALVGFAILGKDFVSLWLGAGYEDVWGITLILMLPAIWELSQNVCLSILRAKNLLGFRTLALLIGMVLNFVVSWFGTKHFGYYAAAVGTALSITVASLILMNLYYYRVLHLNVLRIFGQILKQSLLPIICATAVLTIVQALLYNMTWGLFAGKVVIYVTVLTACVFLSCRSQRKQSGKKDIL